MPAGRPAKPTAVLKLQGTYERHRHQSRADESLSGGEPIKPAAIGKDGGAMWDRVVRLLPAEALGELDTDALTAMCLWYQRFRTKMRRTDYKSHVEAAMAWKNCAGLMSKFGMTPVDRTKIKAESEREDDDPLLGDNVEAAG